MPAMNSYIQPDAALSNGALRPSKSDPLPGFNNAPAALFFGQLSRLNWLRRSRT
jgi:hypothetical protein